MSWICRLSNEAAGALRRLPQDRRKHVAQAIDEMKTNPTSGDVRPIKNGKFKGVLRKRVDRYRIVFSIGREERVVNIAAILTRTEHTYR